MPKRNIFISVGTHPQQFDRLLAEADRISAKNKDLQFFAQIGNSEYEPKNFGFARFLEEKEYVERFKKSDLIIAHGGAGTIINALELNKPLIVVPRLKKFKEHTDDHQLDLAKVLEKNGKCLAVYEIERLENAINNSKDKKYEMSSEKEGIIKKIKDFIEKEGRK
ncbi:MAG: beta-1,4-galactosyltransferase [Candidatus Diapherotrites archaeon CG08_land_8_20_14_0_20_34_12]|nr:MAG: beta-1,4-galactosyltransferase [Candidatus Diapherotrites archaeon CG08_land_8_20_14_0_20_34_12]